jgi:hypothetical protein
MNTIRKIKKLRKELRDSYTKIGTLFYNIFPLPKGRGIYP